MKLLYPPLPKDRILGDCEESLFELTQRTDEALRCIFLRNNSASREGITVRNNICVILLCPKHATGSDTLLTKNIRNYAAAMAQHWAEHYTRCLGNCQNPRWKISFFDSCIMTQGADLVNSEGSCGRCFQPSASSSRGPTSCHLRVGQRERVDWSLGVRIIQSGVCS